VTGRIPLGSDFSVAQFAAITSFRTPAVEFGAPHRQQRIPAIVDPRRVRGALPHLASLDLLRRDRPPRCDAGLMMIRNRAWPRGAGEQ
jgi:hypothetical protein